MSGVVVVLVSHDGAPWLPAVTDGIRAQTATPSAVVAVDTNSLDGSAELIEERLTPYLPTAVLRAEGQTSFPQAVDLAVAEIQRQGLAPEWLWLLHDDSNPAPDALEQLLAAARPDDAILGAKLREWPSLKRLLELGVTISGTGRRETGLERGEYDQGQHDDVREVLAVNTAGMLVRPEVLAELGGFDPGLPMFGNDIDLGWRAAAAGRVTRIVPQAVVFHAEAAHRGIRRTALTGRHTHFQERRAAIYTLLANGRWWPLQAIRLFLGSLLRMVGYLLVRSPGEALDELAAVISVLARPGQVIAARRRRAASTSAAAEDRERVRRLLAPWWLPYRHGLDFVSDIAAALTNQAADVAERRREAAAERDPNPPVARHRDEEDEYAETGWVVRFFTDPVAVGLAFVAIALLIGARGAFGDVVGGALSPSPLSAGDWWRLHVESTHAVGFGSDVPAPAYVLPLALLASLVGPVTAVSLLLLLAAPIALWGAWRFLRVVGRLLTRFGAPRWLLLWGAATYAVIPLVAGAYDGGRLGVLVATALLPWLAHAALGFADPEATRRWRAAWRTGLLLALTTAFTPTLWWVFLLLAVVVTLTAAVIGGAAARGRTVWGPPALALVVPVVLLLPWWLPAVLNGSGRAVLLDIGRVPTDPSSGVDLVLGRLGELGAPWWLGLVLPILALAALLPRATRIGVVVCWLVVAVAAVAALPLGLLRADLVNGQEQQLGLGAALLVVHGAWITAVVIAGVQLRDTQVGRIGQSGVIAGALAAFIAPVVGLVWFAGFGGDGLADAPATGIPAHMEEDAARGPERGVLVIRGDAATGLTWSVYRWDGPTIGEDEITALTPVDPEVADLISELVSQPTQQTVTELRERGIEYVVQPAPADGDVASRLDATPGLERASADNRLTQAWETGRNPEVGAAPTETSWLRIALLVVQGVAVPVVIVLGLPTIRRRRS